MSFLDCADSQLWAIDCGFLFHNSQGLHRTIYILKILMNDSTTFMMMWLKCIESEIFFIFSFLKFLISMCVGISIEKNIPKWLQIYSFSFSHFLFLYLIWNETNCLRRRRRRRVWEPKILLQSYEHWLPS